MFKRIVASIIAAAIFPLFYLFFLERSYVFTRTDSITDECGFCYTLLYDLEDIMFVKSDGSGKILGKWKTDRTNGYNYISADAMNVFDGEFYCVLTEINSKNFTICRRSWLKIDFKRGAAETVYEKAYGNYQNAYCTSLTVSNEKMVTVSSLIEGILVTDIYDKTETIIVPETEAVVNYAASLPDGRIIFSDILNRIYIVDKNGNSRRIYKANAAGDFYGLSVDENGFCRIYDTETDECLISTSNVYDGNIVFKSGKSSDDTSDIYTYHDSFSGTFFIYLALGVAIGIALFTLMSLKRFPLLLKITAIIILCLGIGGACLFTLINSIMERTQLEKSLEKACMTAKIIEAQIDSERFENIDWRSPETSGYFFELAKLMEYSGENDQIQTTDEGSYIIFDDKNYCWIYPIVDREIKCGICDQNPVNLPINKAISKNLLKEYNKVANGEINSAACGIYDNSFDWVIAVSPLKNSEGEIIALIETGISKLNYTTSSKRNSTYIFLIVAVFEIITGTLILIAAGIALLPLKRLHTAVEAAGNGDYGNTVRARGRDEIAGVANAFNVMSMRICNHTKNLSKLNEAYLRFLPSGIISSIGKESVLSVSRGDYSRISGYILHIQLVNFSEQTINFSNDEVFEFINDLSREIMENIIGKNGVIESYNQDEYICLFSCADPAHNAAVSLIRRLRELYPQLKATFVIVSDSVLLGIVGHEKRLGTIMLSRGIGLSKKLCQIASVCGANLIVTSDVSFSVPCPQRLLGKFVYEGDKYTFFDCYEGDEISAYLNKMDSCALFEEMVSRFYENNWLECRRLALSYLERNKNDPAAIRYLFLCEHNIKNSIDEADIECVIL